MYGESICTYTPTPTPTPTQLGEGYGIYTGQTYSSSTNACNGGGLYIYTGITTCYLSPSDTPSTGDYFYKDIYLTPGNTFVGNSNWYIVKKGSTIYACQIGATGQVIDVLTCPTPSATPTTTPTNTQTSTQTQTPSNTPTNTQTPSNTPTQTQTPTVTPSPTPTQTPSPTNTQTPTQTPTNTQTPTKTQTPTPTVTPSLPALTLSVSSYTIQSCYTTSDGTFTLSASGGNGATYEYSKDNTNWQGSATFSSLAGTTYTGYVRNSGRNGTVASVSVSSLARTAPNATFTVTNLLCAGSDGSVAVTDGTGGSGSGYSVALNYDNATYYSLPKTFSNLTSGLYDFYLKDSSGCTKMYSYTITQPFALIANITDVVNTSGAGGNGSLTIRCQGGTGTKTMRLYKDTTEPYNDYTPGTLIHTATTTGTDYASTSVSVTNLDCGYYYMVVTDDNGCVSTTSGESRILCPLTSFTIYGGSSSGVACGGSPTAYGTPYAYDGVTRLIDGATYYTSNGVTPFTQSGTWSDHVAPSIFGTFGRGGVFTKGGNC